MRNWMLTASKNIVLWLSVLFLGFLSVVSLVSTTYFNTESSFAERPAYRWDNVLLQVLMLALVLLILFWFDRKGILKRLNTKWLAMVAVLFVTGLSFLWVKVSFTYPEADQKAVSWVAYLMSQNNFLFFEHGKYMQIYPNQLGLAAILEGLYRISGGENWKLFMYVTALSNGAVVCLLYRITHELFEKERIDRLVLLGSMGCVQLILYTTFLYGITLGLALSLGAFYAVLLFFKKENWLWGVLAAFLIGASVLVKNNYSIVLVALVLLILHKSLEKRSIVTAALAVFLILSTSLMSRGLTGFYEHRSNLMIGSGMPKSLWMAMGMQEGERAEGWYNAFNFDTFVASDCDQKESDRIAREAIAQSLQKFRENPAYAAAFYYKKTVSQWNEPTYEALWVNQFHSGNFSKIVQSIYDGKLYQVLHEYMNFYQSLILAAAFVCLLAGRKKWNLSQLFFALVILGGFFFHTLWEAKSQYIFPYFVMLLPYGAAGLDKALDGFAMWKRRKGSL